MTESTKLDPPIAKRVDAGDDPYVWLRERENPEVAAYLRAENEYAEAVMQSTGSLRERLYAELLSRIKETDLSVPERVGEYLYYSRTETGKQYPIHCRKRGTLGADEEVLLDQNVLAEGAEYFKVGAFAISPDHGLLAYSVDTDGSERFTLQVKDLSSGDMLVDRIPGIYYSVEWAGDGRTLFYTTLDDAHRPYRLHRHTLGDDPRHDTIVYQEDDGAFFLELYKTKDRRFLIMHLESNTTTEARFVDADAPAGDFRTIDARRPGVEYYVEHREGQFLIMTNEDAINFRLMSAAVDDPIRAGWTERIPHRPEVKLDSVEPFRDHLVVVERENGQRAVRVIEMPEWESHPVEFADPVYSVYLSRNPEYESGEVRFIYTSLVTPRSVFDYDMRSRKRVLRKETEVLGGYDRTLYRSERIYATAEDGRQVPISLVYRADLKRDGRNPALLYGYGAYGSCTDPVFDSTRLSLLDRGFVYAIAHVRGGGDLGRPWYEDGKLQHKRNSFTDFIACAERLIAEGFTSTDRLVIRGGSAGGLLMGAVVNMRPELFRLVVAKVPFVDVVNTMLDASIPLTVIEREEWGDPRREPDRTYIASYSPYDNVEAQDYPDMLITGGLNDPRVGYWEPAKWAARLRATKTDGNVLLLKTEMDAGHAGPSGRYEYLRDLAFEFAFVLSRLEIPFAARKSEGDEPARET